MKHLYITLALALIVSVSKAQSKLSDTKPTVQTIVPVKVPHTFTLSEATADSLMQAIQVSNPILFKKGSGITLEAAQFIGSINQSVLATFTAQYWTWYPEAKRKADSLNKSQIKKP